VLEHVDVNPVGVWAEALADRGLELEVVRADREPLPALEGHDLIVSMGGPQSAYDDASHPWLAGEARLLAAAATAGVPVLGVCLGAQLVARGLGGTCVPGRGFEFGLRPLQLAPGAARWLGALEPGASVLHFHADTFTLPPGARQLASSAAYANQAFAAGSAVGLQFHLEPTLADAERWLAYPGVLDAVRDQLPDGGADGFLVGYARTVGRLRDAAHRVVDACLARFAEPAEAWPS
jgi:GMP synthase (glutamine-hydrolysing)